MPLISARNPDVLDFANIDDESDKNSLLKRRSPLTIPNKNLADPEELSVMTMHSAFQSTALGDQSSTANQSSNSFFPGQGLGAYFRRVDKKKSQEPEKNDGHQASDEFSMNSLPIQDSDIESIEQTWNDQQAEMSDVRHANTTRKKFSSQTYSDKGVGHSSLHTMNNSLHTVSKSTSTLSRAHMTDCSSVKSIGTASFGDGSYSGYAQSASKTRSTARRVPSRRLLSTHNESASPPSSGSDRSTVINGRGQATSEKNERKDRSSKKGPPKPKSRRGNNRSGKSSGSSNTKNRGDSESVSSQASNTSSNGTSASNLEKEMFRLSLELASTLANLDLSKMEINKYQKQVKNLEDTVKNLLDEKVVLTQRLQFHEEKAARKAAMKSKRTVDLSKRTVDLSKRTIDLSDEPACVTPTKGNEDIDQKLDSTEDNRKHDESGEILFPELNESHLSCSDLYTSQIVDKSADKYEDEFGTGTSIDLIDPKNEVFSDDPFATFNYSSDKNEEELANIVASVEPNSEGEEECVLRTSKGAQSVLDTSESRNPDTSKQGGFSFGSVTNQFKNRAYKHPMEAKRNRIPDHQERKSGSIKNEENDNDSHVSIKFHQENNQKPLNNSTRPNRMNISRILRFGKDEKDERDALSVSIHSTQSHHTLGSLLEVFGRKRRD